MPRCTTSSFGPVNTNAHDRTPNKTALLTISDFNEKHGIKFKLSDLYAYTNIPERTGRRLRAQNKVRTRHNDPRRHETRGRKAKITKEQLIAMDNFLKTNGFEGRILTWLQLGEQVGISGVCERTIQRIMGNSMGYSKCITCQKAWVSPSNATNRLRYTREMLEKYPTTEAWRRVRFSDKIHFSLGPQGKLRVIRRPGDRCCGDCIQIEEKGQSSEYRVHAWVAFGYNFKSEIVFYKTRVSNGKMTQKEYLEQILKPHVLPWIERGDDFVLEEDGDSSHGPGLSRNIVQVWKEKVGLECFFNCAGSPDLAPIENGWQSTKQYARKHSHWDEKTLQELIKEGWEKITQRWINKRVNSMPKRLREVDQRDGQLATAEACNTEGESEEDTDAEWEIDLE